jgi:negative regulator of flagellin synthesis FlgM
VPPAGASQPTAKLNETKSKDSVSISSSAQKQAEFGMALEIVKNAPDIREEKVEEAKKNLASYMKDSTVESKVLDAITEKILRSLTR